MHPDHPASLPLPCSPGSHSIFLTKKATKGAVKGTKCPFPLWIGKKKKKRQCRERSNPRVTSGRPEGGARSTLLGSLMGWGWPRELRHVSMQVSLRLGCSVLGSVQTRSRQHTEPYKVRRRSPTCREHLGGGELNEQNLVKARRKRHYP